MTIDPLKENDYFIKLTGKANIPCTMEIGRNYKVQLQGTVTSLTESDKDDGSHSIFYRFEPVIVEIVDDRGVAIRAKDTRRMSALLRAKLWKEWGKAQTNLDFGDWYEVAMQRMIQSSEDVASMYGPDDRK